MGPTADSAKTKKRQPVELAGDTLSSTLDGTRDVCDKKKKCISYA